MYYSTDVYHNLSPLPFPIARNIIRNPDAEKRPNRSFVPTDPVVKKPQSLSHHKEMGMYDAVRNGPAVCV
jgi:hypothetical protein